jgi:hypothetical protein
VARERRKQERFSKKNAKQAENGNEPIAEKSTKKTKDFYIGQGRNRTNGLGSSCAENSTRKS